MKQRRVALRHIIKFWTLLLLWSALLSPTTSAQEPVAQAQQMSLERPNIVLILADDLGYSDISPYGATRIETPTLQRLAEGGMRLTQMTNTSKCFPSRAELLTGAYAQQASMHDEPGHFENTVMFGEVLQRAGYHTVFVGKHHGTDNPYRWGFDHYWGLRDGAANYFNPGRKRPFDGESAQKESHYPRTFVFDDSVAAPYTPERGYYSTDTWTRWALDLLKEEESNEQPFFLYLAYQAPHDPLQAPPEAIQRYEGAFDDGYAAVRQARYERLTRQIGPVDEETYPLSEPTHRDWSSLSDSAKADQARRMEVYAAMINRMDENIGRVVDYLEQSGELKNTLILFASDNGANPKTVKIGKGPIGSMSRYASLKEDWANVGNTPFRYYKNYSYQGGVATPFIAYWPGVIEPGSTSNYVSRFLDVMPTLVDIAGATYPEQYKGDPVVDMQGRSLVPVFKGKQEARREGPLYWKWSDGRAVYRDGWKLVEEGDRGWELYDLFEDRTETNNLAAERPSLVEDLARSWQQWYEGTARYRNTDVSGSK
jgi:arylsulfatase